jgi:hypothetical protein
MPYDDLIQKSTNTDVDHSLAHLHGVKGIQLTDLTISLKIQKDHEAQYTSAYSNKEGRADFQFTTF